uniref:Dihydrolipoyllysine-residue succinyltransferase component of 2-oxoglutarate dehydrogenase complex, mitochondrial n=1 Tax=Lygus hesperus TaxID=30085 RepID=A0A0A9Y3N9_LYGHE
MEKKDGAFTQTVAATAETEPPRVEAKTTGKSADRADTPAPLTKSPQQATVAAVPVSNSTSSLPSSTSKQQIITGVDPRVKSVRISSMRQRIADRLKASQNTAAMLTTFNEVDMTPLIELRAKYKDDFYKRHEVKLGLMSAFVKASAIALKDIPIVNASFGDNTIDFHEFVDISVAVATPRGLVVPVIRDVQNMTLADIEKTISDYATRARVNKLTMTEMTGGTFTISNGGVFGS